MKLELECVVQNTGTVWTVDVDNQIEGVLSSASFSSRAAALFAARAAVSETILKRFEHIAPPSNADKRASLSHLICVGIVKVPGFRISIEQEVEESIVWRFDGDFYPTEKAARRAAMDSIPDAVVLRVTRAAGVEPSFSFSVVVRGLIVDGFIDADRYKHDTSILNHIAVQED